MIKPYVVMIRYGELAEHDKASCNNFRRRFFGISLTRTMMVILGTQDFFMTSRASFSHDCSTERGATTNAFRIVFARIKPPRKATD